MKSEPFLIILRRWEFVNIKFIIVFIIKAQRLMFFFNIESH
jgi:hypothetical protein